MSSVSSTRNGLRLILYMDKSSYYTQKRFMKKKISFTSQIIDLGNGEQYNLDFLKISPRGEVPALRDGDTVVLDSPRIIDYLEENFTNDVHPSLTPLDSTEKSKMIEMRELIDKIPAVPVTFGSFYNEDDVQGAKLPFLEPSRSSMKDRFEQTSQKLRKLAETLPEFKKDLLQKAQEHDSTYKIVTNKESFNQLMSTVDDTLRQVEQQLNSRKGEGWLINNDFTIADISLIVLLYRLDVIGLSKKIFKDRPKITSYLHKVSERESYKKTY